MSKKLRRTPIYIAPEIIGWIDESFKPHIIDERNSLILDPANVYHKIDIYERQVRDWFLNPAKTFVKSKDKKFIALMVCLSYLEGVEQFRRGQSSNNQSRSFFVSAISRIYPNKFLVQDLKDFYSEARCGLFHNGMVKGKIIINNRFLESLNFSGNDIEVSPTKFLRDIVQDFDNYVNELKTNEQSRNYFDIMYSNV